MAHNRSFFFEAPMIEPEFDEDSGELALYAHEIETIGAVQLHPDNDRIRFNPVPLHGGRYDTISTMEWKERREKEFQKYLEEKRQREQREREPAVAPELEPEQLPPTSPPPPPPLPFPGNYNLLTHMRLTDPIKPRQARVYGGHVMVNESELDYWMSDDRRRTLAEVWRGHGLIMFKLP